MRTLLLAMFTFGFSLLFDFIFHRKVKSNDTHQAVDAPSVDEGVRLGTLFGTLPLKNYTVDWFGQPNYQPVYAKGQGKK